MNGNCNKAQFETLLICSTRYAVGRMTYVTFEMAEIIKQNIDVLSQNCIHVLHRDIKTEIDRGNYGMQMDLENWSKILVLLESKMKPNV